MRFRGRQEPLIWGYGALFPPANLSFASLRRAVGGSLWSTWAIYLSIGWIMVSLCPHDNPRIHKGSDLQGPFRIEYGFHVTLMLAGIILAYSLLTMLRPGAAGAHGAQAAGAASPRVR